MLLATPGTVQLPVPRMTSLVPVSCYACWCLPAQNLCREHLGITMLWVPRTPAGLASMQLSTSVQQPAASSSSQKQGLSCRACFPADQTWKWIPVFLKVPHFNIYFPFVCECFHYDSGIRNSAFISQCILEFQSARTLYRITENWWPLAEEDAPGSGKSPDILFQSHQH